LRRAYLRTETTLDFFADAIATRANPRIGALLRAADSLARQNNLQFERGGKKFVVAVADQVEVELELEIGDDGNSLEIEINW